MQVDEPFSPPPTHSAQQPESNASTSTSLPNPPSMSAPGASTPPTNTESVPLITITLSCKVQAVHRLWSTHLTEEQNFRTYGDSINLHGHSITFFVTFAGPLCPKTGQIRGIDLLEEVLTISLCEPLNHKNLDKDISYFVSRPSTIGNLCLFAWRNVGVVMRPHRGIKVFKVQVESEPCWRNEWSRGVEKVRVSYSGEKTNLQS
ncbi:hypothetical protein JCM5353_000370 [Sporobolomyces roseus]